ncbi:hypothetical protein P4U97_08135 [Bacillus swezeyi]|nr:hypothetical protein [Bacillus swezeyi]
MLVGAMGWGIVRTAVVVMAERQMMDAMQQGEEWLKTKGYSQTR